MNDEQFDKLERKVNFFEGLGCPLIFGLVIMIVIVALIFFLQWGSMI